MSQYTLLRAARQVLTLRGLESLRRGSALQDLGIIPDGSVLIRDGRVVEVGSTRRIENLKEARNAIEVDVHGQVVMPGFIDPSLHVSLFAGEGRRLRRIGQMYDETLDLLRSCALNGTVAAEVKGTSDTAEYHSDLSVLRRLAKLGNQPVGMVRTWLINQLPSADSEFMDFHAVLTRLARKGHIECVELIASDDTEIHPVFQNILMAAGLRVKLSWRGHDAVVLGRIVRQLNPCAVYCPNVLGLGEIAALAGFSGSVVISMGHTLNELAAVGARDAIDAGLAVAISSGYQAGERSMYSMQVAVSLASVSTRLSLEESISAATINAAHAVGRGSRLGMIVPGREADLIVLAIPDYRELPRQFGINHVGMVLRQGEAVISRRGWKMTA